MERSDCIFICREKTIRAAFGADDSIDAVSDSAEFDLAALMGRRGGDTQCVYCKNMTRKLNNVGIISISLANQSY